MLHKLNLLTSFKGVMGRKNYWLYQLVSLGISIAGSLTLMGIASVFHPATDANPILILLIVLRGVFMVAALIVAFSAITRRLHDVNLSGYYAFLFLPAGLFLPLALGMLIALGAVPPRHQNNKYLGQ